jgi:hypothetical protein
MVFFNAVRLRLVLFRFRNSPSALAVEIGLLLLVRVDHGIRREKRPNPAGAPEGAPAS